MCEACTKKKNDYIIVELTILPLDFESTENIVIFNKNIVKKINKEKVIFNNFIVNIENIIVICEGLRF